jgi:hypothetical protein
LGFVRIEPDFIGFSLGFGRSIFVGDVQLNVVVCVADVVNCVAVTAYAVAKN